MKLIKLSKESWREAVDVLKNGGVVAHPTDTCYGLAADITNQAAVEKIIKIKQMDPEKPMSIAVANLTELAKYGELSPKALEIVQKYLPGAVTLLVPKNKAVPDFYYPHSELIGLRIPDHELTLDLVRGLGCPITTTSANVTMRTENYSGKEVFEAFYDEEFEPDLVFDLDLDDPERIKPSTIVQVVGDAVTVVRWGEVEILP